MQDPPPPPYLTEEVSKSYDISLEVFQSTVTMCLHVLSVTSSCSLINYISSWSLCSTVVEVGIVFLYDSFSKTIYDKNFGRTIPQTSKNASGRSWRVQNLVNSRLESILAWDSNPILCSWILTVFSWFFLDYFANHTIVFCFKAHIKPAGHEDSGVVTRSNLKHMWGISLQLKLIFQLFNYFSLSLSLSLSLYIYIYIYVCMYVYMYVYTHTHIS